MPITRGELPAPGIRWRGYQETVAAPPPPGDLAAWLGLPGSPSVFIGLLGGGRPERCLWARLLARLRRLDGPERVPVGAELDFCAGVAPLVEGEAQAGVALGVPRGPLRTVEVPLLDEPAAVVVGHHHLGDAPPARRWLAIGVEVGLLNLVALVVEPGQRDGDPLRVVVEPIVFPPVRLLGVVGSFVEDRAADGVPLDEGGALFLVEERPLDDVAKAVVPGAYDGVSLRRDELAVHSEVSAFRGAAELVEPRHLDRVPVREQPQVAGGVPTGLLRHVVPVVVLHAHHGAGPQGFAGGVEQGCLQAVSACIVARACDGPAFLRIHGVILGVERALLERVSGCVVRPAQNRRAVLGVDELALEIEERLLGHVTVAVVGPAHHRDPVSARGGLARRVEVAFQHVVAAIVVLHAGASDPLRSEHRRAVQPQPGFPDGLSPRVILAAPAGDAVLCDGGLAIGPVERGLEPMPAVVVAGAGDRRPEQAVADELSAGSERRGLELVATVVVPGRWSPKLGQCGKL